VTDNINLTLHFQLLAFSNAVTLAAMYPVYTSFKHNSTATNFSFQYNVEKEYNYQTWDTSQGCSCSNEVQSVSAVTVAKFDLTATPEVRNLFSRSLPAASRIAFADIATIQCSLKQIQDLQIKLSSFLRHQNCWNPPVVLALQHCPLIWKDPATWV